MQSSFGLAVDDPYTEHEDGVPPGRENSPFFFVLPGMSYVLVTP